MSFLAAGQGPRIQQGGAITAVATLFRNGFAETETTYFAKGEPWRLIFVKDLHGAVTSLVFRQQGQEWTAVKVP
jgi:hypothetical protein